eukprot:GILJ01008779.1.p1 GENE.GILJ01008779.1~~GILJ01008779.1.p1  ORF type:complete len:750 (-),score=130.32 GILJ01008779.1:187-2436(-)
MERWQNKACASVLMKLQEHQWAGPFMTPVDWKGLSLDDYPKIVKRPMDFGTIKRNLEDNRYMDPSQFLADSKLVFQNCIEYNTNSKSDIRVMCAGLSNEFDKLWKTYYEDKEVKMKPPPTRPKESKKQSSGKKKTDKTAPDSQRSPAVVSVSSDAPALLSPPLPLSAPTTPLASTPAAPFQPLSVIELTSPTPPLASPITIPTAAVTVPLTTKSISWKKRCSAILKKLKTNSYAWPFLEPVDPVKLNVPDYFHIVKRPMDLATVEKKLKGQGYISHRQFADDVRLVFDNCALYNPIGSDIRAMGDDLRKIFEEKWKEVADKMDEEEAERKRLQRLQRPLPSSPTFGMSPDKIRGTDMEASAGSGKKRKREKRRETLALLSPDETEDLKDLTKRSWIKAEQLARDRKLEEEQTQEQIKRQKKQEQISTAVTDNKEQNQRPLLQPVQWTAGTFKMTFSNQKRLTPFKAFSSDDVEETVPLPRNESYNGPFSGSASVRCEEVESKLMLKKIPLLIQSHEFVNVSTVDEPLSAQGCEQQGFIKTASGVWVRFQTVALQGNSESYKNLLFESAMIPSLQLTSIQMFREGSAEEPVDLLVESCVRQDVAESFQLLLDRTAVVKAMTEDDEDTRVQFADPFAVTLFLNRYHALVDDSIPWRWNQLHKCLFAGPLHERYGGVPVTRMYVCAVRDKLKISIDGLVLTSVGESASNAELKAAVVKSDSRVKQITNEEASEPDQAPLAPPLLLKPIKQEH